MMKKKTKKLSSIAKNNGSHISIVQEQYIMHSHNIIQRGRSPYISFMAIPDKTFYLKENLRPYQFIAIEGVQKWQQSHCTQLHTSTIFPCFSPI